MSNVHEFGMDTPGDDTPEEDEYTTVFDDLRTELTTPIDVEPLIMPVPSRPTISVVYEPAVEFDMLRMWMRKSTTGRKKEFDPLLFAYQILSFTCRGMRVRGKEVTKDGEPLTFASPELIEMIGARDTRSAIKRMYGADGHVISASQLVMDEAGYGDIDLEEGEDNPLTQP